MKKFKFFGKILYKDEWVNINPEVATFEIPSNIEPFDFFQNLFIDNKYLVIYNEIEE